MDWKNHCYRAGNHSEAWDDIPADTGELEKFIRIARKRIEPWLSAVFQAEHLNLLIGNGFTAGIGVLAKVETAGMSRIQLEGKHAGAIDTHAQASADRMKRGKANIEDQIRSALAVLEGLSVIDPGAGTDLKSSLDAGLSGFLDSLLKSEAGIASPADQQTWEKTRNALESFLLSFASRAASRERLHIFTTNYDRLIEHGCDIAGLRIIDRFVGALNPVFRSTRVEVDVHYNPPGIRGEPRYMEGVIRLTKLHGSLDWHFDPNERRIVRKGIPFGASSTHTDIPKNPVDTVMIYPNPAKDVETTQYPYAELFRDFATATCRPNSVIVSYGYGFGDDHINRVILDMLTIPSTHLVVITYGIDDRLKSFCAKTRSAQVSLLVGTHFGDLSTLIENYLPKPALDYITGRMTDLMKGRPEGGPNAGKEEGTSMPETPPAPAPPSPAADEDVPF